MSDTPAMANSVAAKDHSVSGEGEQCIFTGISVPPAEMGRYAVEGDRFAETDVIRYLEGQARGEHVLHIEWIKEEFVSGERYEAWHVVTDKETWWVITNPVNLYSQRQFPSLDYTFSFHIGLMQRLRERSRAEPDAAAIQFAEIERRQREIMSAFERAVEPVDFQTVGLMLRELLLTVVQCLSQFVEFPKGANLPKRGDFKAQVEIIASTIAPGRSNQPIRKFIRESSGDVWEVSNWLAHARNADRVAAMIACMSCDTAVGNLLLAFRRASEEGPDQCSTCGSRHLRTYFDGSREEGYYFQSCPSCGWNNHKGAMNEE